MAGRLDGKIALITGGARGQGAAEANLFAEEGATVVITDVLDSDGEATAAGSSSIRYLHHDVTNEDEWISVVQDVLEDYGKIDAFINNAGIFRSRPIAELSVEEYREVIDINQVGVFLGLKHVGPRDVPGGIRLDHQHFIGRRHARRGRFAGVLGIEVGGARHDQGCDERVCPIRCTGQLDSPGAD